MRLRDPRLLHLLGLYALPVVVAAAGWGVAAALGAWLRPSSSASPCDWRSPCAHCAGRRRGCACTRSPSRTTPRKYAGAWTGSACPTKKSRTSAILGVLLTGRTVPWLEVPPGLTRSAIHRASCATCGASTRAPAAASARGSSNRRPPRSNSRRASTGGSATTCASGCTRIVAQRDLSCAPGAARSRPSRGGNARCCALCDADAGLRRPAHARRHAGARGARALAADPRNFRRGGPLLADGRRTSRVDTLTFADITFASLAALAVLPPEYAGRSLGGAHAHARHLDADWRAEIERFRARPSGQFILRLYREERLSRLTDRAWAARPLTPRARSPRRSSLRRCACSAAARTPAWRFDSSSEDGSQTRARMTPRSTAASNRLGYQRCPFRKDLVDSLLQRHGVEFAAARGAWATLLSERELRDTLRPAPPVSAVRTAVCASRARIAGKPGATRPRAALAGASRQPRRQRLGKVVVGGDVSRSSSMASR